MELGFLLGLHALPAIEAPVLAPSDIVILGARDAPSLRDEGVASLRTVVPFVDDVELTADPQGVTGRLVDAIPRPWWLHIDLDVLSTQALPAVDYPQPGGIGWAELTAVSRTALSARPLGMDVTIYNPDLDADGAGAERIVGFLADVVTGAPSG
jgi:arginase